MLIIAYIKWLLNGKPMKTYSGYNCGCCGKWHDNLFQIPEYQSYGWQSDTWGLCPNGGCDA